MPMQRRSKEHQCERCRQTFTSLMRLRHHWAAEHAPMTSKDIHTTRDIPRRPQK